MKRNKMKSMFKEKVKELNAQHDKKTCRGENMKV